MKNIIGSLFRQFVFWILFIAFARLVFLLYYVSIIIEKNISIGEVLAGFWYGLRLDIVASSYIIIFPFILLVIQSIYSPKLINVINKIYTIMVLLIYSMITIAEIGIYDEWKTKIPAKALMYLENPQEIYNSSVTGIFFLLLFLLLAQIIIGYFIYSKYFYKDVINIKRNWWAIAFALVTPVFILVGLRGGVQQIPIVQSNSYYSKHNFLNVAATNSGYNLLHSIFENKKYMGENPFRFYTDEESLKLVQELHQVEKDTTISILNVSRPNIVLFIMESWSADLIESLGGFPGATPEFKKLEKDGILFTNFWANGTRSEQGMASIFSGFPAHPVSSITIQPDKYASLPSLVKRFNMENYLTSFYFGGQLIYGNIKGYIYFNEFDRITEIYDFPESIPQGKLGVHDEFVFDRQLSEISNDQQPFFSSVFSSSTHSPYDMPMEIKNFHENRLDNLYLNSGYYADSCIGDYIHKARSKDWYDNTLFIFVADHSRETYKDWNYHSPEYHKVFMLLYGNVIKEEFRGTQVDKVSSQIDIASTLLYQIELDASDFTWSKNIFNPYSDQFAAVAFEEGVGWIRPYGYYFYDKRYDRYYCKELPEEKEEQAIKEGKSYLQVLFQQYIDL